MPSLELLKALPEPRHGLHTLIEPLSGAIIAARLGESRKSPLNDSTFFIAGGRWLTQRVISNIVISEQQ